MTTRVDRTKSGKRVQHGTYGAYTNHGCRCPECKDANRVRTFGRNRRNGTRPWAEYTADRRAAVQHGTQTKYVKHGCRCDECRRWARENRRRQRVNGSGAPCPHCGGVFANARGIITHQSKMGCGEQSS